MPKQKYIAIVHTPDDISISLERFWFGFFKNKMAGTLHNIAIAIRIMKTTFGESMAMLASMATNKVATRRLIQSITDFDSPSNLL